MEKIYQIPLPIEGSNPIAFFRRGKAEHIRALYETGEIYMNTVSAIRTLDSNTERSDIDDGFAKRLYIGDATVNMCDVGKDMEKEGIRVDGKDLTIQEDTIEMGIYCLSAIHTGHCLGERPSLKFDTRFFGDALIVITDPQQFINRLLERLKNAGFKDIQHGLVTYYPDNYSGPIGKFRKHKRFSHQNEYRVFVLNETGNPIKVHIGSLRDIAALEHNQQFTMTYTDGVKQTIFIL